MKREIAVLLALVAALTSCEREEKREQRHDEKLIENQKVLEGDQRLEGEKMMENQPVAPKMNNNGQK